MLGAFKKLISQSTIDGNSPNLGLSPPILSRLDANLQRKLGKGVQFNMKILIKGDRNVGKSCLFARLQGKNFIEAYEPTSEIQIANINWNYKNTENVVKVEIWDVVDVGKKTAKEQINLKLNNENIHSENNSNIINKKQAMLDAEQIDVYKNSHGIIIILDITKKWTLDYMKKELEKIKIAVPILILANKRDLQHKRVIDMDEIIFAVNECENNSKLLSSTHIKIIESSMRNNFGLKYIHKFFNLPFLELQRDTLMHQLAVNSENIQITLEELKYHAQSFEQNYDLYTDQINGLKKRPNLSSASITPMSNSSESPSITKDFVKNSTPSSPRQTPISDVSQNLTGMDALKLNEGNVTPQILPLKPQLQDHLLKTFQMSKNDNNINNGLESLNMENQISPAKIKDGDDVLSNFIPREQIDYSFFETAGDTVSNTPTKAKKMPLKTTEIEHKDILTPPKSTAKIKIEDAHKRQPVTLEGNSSTDEENDASSNPMVIIYPEDLDD